VADHVLIQTLALVVGTAAITTVVFQRLKLPVVLGYLVAGILVGPHTSLWFVADAHLVETLAELGVILLMFSIGLELSIRGVIGVGVGTIVTAVIEVGLMVVLGSAVGGAFGLDGAAGLFVGVIVAISSTTIISRSFDEHPPSPAQKRRVFGLLVVEDLLAILLLTVLTAVSRGGDAGVGQLAVTLGKLLGFLAATVIGGLLVIPRLVQFTIKLGRHETTLVLAVGVCFGLAILADAAGYSVALGAFLAGALVAEGGANESIEPMVEPLRDLFAAIFFVSVGMLIDPIAIRDQWLAIAVLLVVVVGGKIVTVSLGVFLSGRGIPAGIATGMTMAQIGELSFVAASIGVGAKVLPPSWYAVAVAVSAVTTALTPLLVRKGPAAAAWIERMLPRRLQTFEALYASWIEGIGTRSSARPTATRSLGPRVRRLVMLLTLDSLLLLGVVLATGLLQAKATRALTRAFVELDPAWADAAVLVAAFALALPLLFGLGRLSRGLAVALAEASLPTREGLDLALAPRRMLIVALQVPILLVTTLPLLAATGALAPPLAIGLLVLLVVYEAWQVWRRAGDLQAHVSAGAQAIVEILAAQGHRAATAPSDGEPEPDELSILDSVLPGLGTPTAVRVGERSALAGLTLGASNLRGLTGATVLAIQRGPRSIPVPAASDTLEVGDVLALAGSTEAIATARALLTD